MRTEWIAKRKNHNNRSQMYYARQGIVTEEMQYVAAREKLSAELVRSGSGPRPDDHSRERQSPEPGTDVHWRGLHVQDQLEHRQLVGHIRSSNASSTSCVIP